MQLKCLITTNSNLYVVIVCLIQAVFVESQCSNGMCISTEGRCKFCQPGTSGDGTSLCPCNKCLQGTYSYVGSAKCCAAGSFLPYVLGGTSAQCISCELGKCSQ